ncbi:MAG: magnesium transporter CorA family protein [Actinomycetota bacterium]|nr:magnesium transporter CorA family protein [Actinomycetota bacterium]
MSLGARWIDLLDPSREEIARESPVDLHRRALERLLARPRLDQDGRPTFESHGDYVFALLLVPVGVPEEDRIYYQEIDLVLTPEVALTVRKTPPGEAPFDLGPLQLACDAHGKPTAGTIAYYLVDDVADRYLSLVELLDVEIEELEDGVETWPSSQVRRRLSALRRDVLQLRRTLAPTRDAVRRVVDGRVDVGDDAVFGRALELDVANANDKLTRAVESLDLARELIASVRDYHQSKISQEQNEIVKRLAVIASLVLFPTFLVGVYGQNFDHMPELGWRLGYAFSWGLIVLTTIAQLAFFRRKKWI